jgi:hypothetical protein
LACHAAPDAASGLCFSGFLLEFIPMKIGAGMTIIVKEFMAQCTRGVNYYMLWVIKMPFVLRIDGGVGAMIFSSGPHVVQ